MKKKLIILLLIGLLLFMIGSSFSGKYNSLVRLDEGTKSAWSQVENVYQRRLDLIDNLVATVKGYADFEKETLTGVIEARAKATQTQINANDLNGAALQQFQQSQTALSSALSRLMVVVEKYPNLKANQNFLELQSQLEGTENRIAVERKKFNNAIASYNTTIRRFPTNLMAGFFDFESKAYFEADKEASKAPKVEF